MHCLRMQSVVTTGKQNIIMTSVLFVTDKRGDSVTFNVWKYLYLISPTTNYFSLLPLLVLFKLCSLFVFLNRNLNNIYVAFCSLFFFKSKPPQAKFQDSRGCVCLCRQCCYIVTGKRGDRLIGSQNISILFNFLYTIVVY